MASPEGALDHVWVMSWLEEVGLPQYKPNFVANLVDGRMLSCLTLVRGGAGGRGRVGERHVRVM